MTPSISFARSPSAACNQTSYVLDLMEKIEASESWGLGSAGFSSVAFKGGWDPRAAASTIPRGHLALACAASTFSF
jgi:hypothetical protein